MSRTIILTLTDDTWVADDGTFAAQANALLAGIDGDLASPGGGSVVWDDLTTTVAAGFTVVRTNDTVCTITLPALSTYWIYEDETLTITIPAAILVTSADPVVATGTMVIANDAPLITSITPNSGPVAGGTAITIGGTGFDTGAAPSIDGSACGSIVVVSKTSITCTAPAYTP